MHLETLQVKDFRNYPHAEAQFPNGLNMIIGANGQGKTNLLEAIQILCGMGSHRVTTQGSLIRHGATEAIVRGRGQVLNREMRVDAQIRPTGGVRLQVNGNPPDASTHFSSLPASVTFSPDDLALIKGGPEERRRFLDDIAAQIKPLAAAERGDFEKTLRQRNGVLKAAAVSKKARLQLEVWTAQLSMSAAKLMKNRLDVLEVVRGAVAEKYPQVAGRRAQVTILYKATWAEQVATSDAQAIEKAIAQALSTSLNRDLERGITLVGPHRDDVEIELEGAAARVFASQGEQRSLALSLRLAERDLVAEARNESPLLLLDDVFSELDDNRRRRVAEVVQSGGQSFLTTTEPEAVPLTAERVIRVSEGRLSFDA